MGANFNFDHLCLCRLEGKTVVAPEAPEDEAMEEEEDGKDYLLVCIGGRKCFHSFLVITTFSLSLFI